ncbi:MAG TPA: YtxH domain-containing protein [Prolixibacteraceae bacterium]|jgi:gas vesicle protein
MKNSNVTGKVVGAVIVGTLLGATLGILFAPYKGSRTRNRIARRSKDLTNDLSAKLKEEANALISKAEQLESLAEDKIHNLTDKVKEKVDAFKYRNSKQETNSL